MITRTRRFFPSLQLNWDLIAKQSKKKNTRNVCFYIIVIFLDNRIRDQYQGNKLHPNTLNKIQYIKAQIPTIDLRKPNSHI